MYEVQPQAILMNDMERSENLSKVYRAYRRCYSSEEDVPAIVSDAHLFIKRMVKAGHESPLEHASLTWHITCSRACSHQLVRHRIASYSMQSQRCVKMNGLQFIYPKSIKDNDNTDWRFRDMWEAIEHDYHKLIADGAPEEDARYILPNCTATRLIITMNFRSLLHFFSERCCNRAQWEIRDIAGQMLATCKKLYPCVFEDAGPKCLKLGRCFEPKPCGEQPWRAWSDYAERDID